jgi:ferredoxin-NADP reductase
MSSKSAVRTTLSICDVLPATRRARIVRLALNGQPFDFAPGQAVLVGAERRPYSIASSPEEVRRNGWLEILVGVERLDEPAAHVPLETGALVAVDGPVGDFTFPADPRERRFLFIAGGTGIAPIRAMIHHALDASQRALGLFYTARTPDEFAYQEELLTLARSGRLELRQTVTRHEPDGHWTGAHGRITRDDLQPLVHDPVTLCFICGPSSLVSEMRQILGELGIEKARIKTEEWSKS